MTQKRGRRYKNEPALYDELKRRLNLTLTPTAIEGLDGRAQEWDLSKSELVEQIGRGIILLLSAQEVERLGESSANTKPNSWSNSTDSGSTKGEKPEENKQPSLLSW